MRGGEKIGGKKEPVDGFHAPSNTVYEFDGFLFVCFFFFFFHACSCILDCKSDDAKKQEQAVKAERTQQKHAYIRQLCYNLVVMKECQWRQLKQQNERVQSFFFQNAPSLHPGASHRFRHPRARADRGTIRYTSP